MATDDSSQRRVVLCPYCEQRVNVRSGGGLYRHSAEHVYLAECPGALMSLTDDGRLTRPPERRYGLGAPYVVCLECERRVSLRRDGRIRGHGGQTRCPGSEQVPAYLTESAAGAPRTTRPGPSCGKTSSQKLSHITES